MNVDSKVSGTTEPLDLQFVIDVEIPKVCTGKNVKVSHSLVPAWAVMVRDNHPWAKFSQQISTFKMKSAVRKIHIHLCK